MKIFPFNRITFLFVFLSLLFFFNGCKKSPEELERDLYTYYNRGLEFYERGYFVKAKEFLTNALKAEEQLGTDERKGDIHLFLGLITFEYSEFDISLSHYSEAKEFFRKKLNRRREAMVENNIGNVFAATGEFNTAILHYRNSFNISRLAADKEGEAIANLNTGYAYFDAGFYEKTFDYFTRAYNDYEMLGKPDGEIAASIKIAEVYRVTGAFDDAIRMFNFAKETAEYYNHKSFLPEIYNNIGFTYFELGDIQSAITAYNNGLELLTTSFADAEIKWTILVNLGDVYFTQSRFTRAIEAYEKAISVSNEAGEILSSSFIRIKIAHTYFLKGVMEENPDDISLARQTFISLIKFFEEIDFKPGAINAHFGIAEISFYQNEKKQLSTSINRIKDLLKSSTFEINNRLTASYSLSPEIFSYDNFYSYLEMLGQYDEMLQTGFLFDEIRLKNFIFKQRTFDFGSNEKNNEADSLIYLQHEQDYVLFEIANESAKNSGVRDKVRLNYFKKKHKEIQSRKNENNLFNLTYGLQSNLSINEIQKRLDKDVFLLNFFFNNDTVYVVTVSKENIYSFRSAFSTFELNDKVNRLRDNIYFNRINDAEIILKDFYKILIQPLVNTINKGNKILINNYSNQYSLSEYIPFHALIDENGKYLFEYFNVNYFSGLKNSTIKYEGKNCAIIENRKQSRLTITNLSENFVVFDSSLPNVKKRMKDLSPSSLVSLTPLLYNINTSYNSFLELYSDTTAIPDQNFAFGEFPSLPVANYAFLNFNKDISSPSKIFARLLPGGKNLVLNKYTLSQNAVNTLTNRLLENLSSNKMFKTLEIYNSERDKNIYWISLFEYSRL